VASRRSFFMDPWSRNGVVTYAAAFGGPPQA
jgi:hypothetical protein